MKSPDRWGHIAFAVPDVAAADREMMSPKREAE